MYAQFYLYSESYLASEESPKYVFERRASEKRVTSSTLDDPKFLEGILGILDSRKLGLGDSFSTISQTMYAVLPHSQKHVVREPVNNDDVRFIYNHIST